MIKNSLNKILKKFKSVHGKTYIYDKVEYTSYHKHVVIICKNHGEFLQSPANHIAGKGCNKCGIYERGKSQRSNTKEFKKRSKIIHNNKYNYSLVNYKNSYTKVKIICKIHGEFLQLPGTHLQGIGCFDCGYIKAGLKNRLSTNEFIERADIIHNNIYDYSKTKYIKNNIKVIIICKNHGEFSQIPANHLNGHNCPECSKITAGNFHRSNTLEFIEKSNKIHNFIYDYSLVNYIDDKNKVIIICKKHGQFEQAPTKHLQGQGCNTCVHNVSKIEGKWLDMLGVPKIFRNKTLKIGDRLFRPDAYIKETNTIYEFYGDFWHGNPRVFDQDKVNKTVKKTFGELYQKTVEKEKILIRDGYNLITIWEQDFKILSGIKR